MPRPNLEIGSASGSANPVDAREGQRQVYFGGVALSTEIYSRSRLEPGDAVTGPAIVEQLDSTTVVWPNQIGSVDSFGNLVLERAIS